jgi:hypothetical protein
MEGIMSGLLWIKNNEKMQVCLNERVTSGNTRAFTFTPEINQSNGIDNCDSA